ncbi:hypothetical protein EMN47_05855 [Prolixibacteraceae bacterium JC049]|nr:hypothetical protein [Prolixibacteraceae bacterium JC049]
MKHFMHLALIALITLSACAKKQTTFTIANKYLSRTVSIADNKLHTIDFENKVANKKLEVKNSDEFRLRLSKGTHVEGSAYVLTSANFEVKSVLEATTNHVAFLLVEPKNNLEVEVHYNLKANENYMHKSLKVKPSSNVTLERIDVECVEIADLYQPYQMKQITAQGPAKWRPGLGQPLYTSETATFWGVEFPAANNFVKEQKGYLGYLWGREVKANSTYTSYQSVFGVGDDSKFIQDTFFDYIDQIRIRPLRLQVQYNSWFDFGGRVTKELFAKSVNKVSNELNTKREVPPFKAFVIDDGWQDVKADWSKKSWPVNKKFDKNFATSFTGVKNAKSSLGLWMSPGCNFGARAAVPQMREKGLEALDQYMSLAGPKYMQLLEDRMLELTAQGVTYFKLDGLFGHLNRREFDFNGKAYGVPTMPQLNTEGFKPADKRLNPAKYDELKTYYLVAGSERLMQIFQKQHEVNPDVYIVISNGAYLSPWWLMHIDAVWMINAGDAAGGSNRTQELVYRDGVYYDTWVKEATQFPINSVFNHEPKKTKTGESEKTFREYLWMNLSRGTGFIELYIKTEKLSQTDWDVVADGLKWAHKAFPYFKRSRMHGGNPKKSEVYGYAGWNKKGGFVSMHNPSDKPQTYTVNLDRKLGVISDGNYQITSPLKSGKDLAGKKIKKGATLQVELKPGEVKVFDFHK